ncbi:nucleoid-associated protein [Salinisphaera orenii]|uniref:nucleoid-associated protein n=1 Tax=Salinisphaera orenii TaxID=856731 RepID=UPI000F4C0100|nr:nucleoid-associated protein [Salinisphaera orenii]
MEELNFSIIHELDKAAHSSAVSVRYGKEPLDTTDSTVKDLASQLVGLIGQRQSTVLWGQFSENRREGRFPGAVQKLTQEHSFEEFKRLTSVALDELREQIAKESLATGGYVCFFVYRASGESFLLIVMVKEKGAITVNSDLKPTQITEIDFSKLHQAARVNLDRYREALTGGNEEGEEDRLEESATDGAIDRTYLCFIDRKSADSEVAGYFIEAFGCEKGISANRGTKAAIKAVRQYALSRPQLKRKASYIRRTLIEYFRELPDNETVTIDMVVHSVRSSLSADEMPEADELGEYLNSDANKVPAEFRVSKKALDSMTRIKAKTDRWQLSFDDSALGYSDAEIVFNRETETVSLTNVPHETVRAIKKSLDSRNSTSNRRGPTDG